MVHGNPGDMCFLGAWGFGTWGISLCASTLLSRLDAPDTLHDHHDCWVSQQTNSATNDLKLAECFSCDLNRQSTRMDQRSLQALVRTTQLLRTAQLRILTESNLRWSDNFALQRIGEAGDVDGLKTTCDKIKPWAVRSKRIACARLCYSIGSKETQRERAAHQAIR